MNPRNILLWLTGLLLSASIAGLASWGYLHAARSSAKGFAAEVNTEPLDALAVHTEGRLNSMESLARYTMKYISGPRQIEGQSPVFTYFDLMIRPDETANADIIYIKNKTMRADIRDVLLRANAADPARLEKFVSTGLIAPSLLERPEVKTLIDGWSRDLVRTAKFVDDIDGAMHLRDPMLLTSQLRVVPPPPMDGGADRMTPWLSVNDLYPKDTTNPELLAKIPGSQQSAVRVAWKDVVTSWAAQDAEATNQAIVAFASSLRAINPALYPDVQKLNAESLYFKLGHLTWVWVMYLAAVLFLLMSVAYKWDGARAIGLGAFAGAFTLHTAAVMVRWYVSGRWPNANMFEAVTTSVWLGTALAVAIEFAARKSPMRNLFALGAGAASMAALMSAHYIPQLDANIRNMMPVLHDVWLYIHTNVIIFSYCLIFMAAVTSLAYLGYRLLGGEATFARVGGAGEMLALSGGAAGAEPLRGKLGEVLDGVTMLLMELSFVLLWAGIAMGAIWADESWGRPWGWDPKEVFALNTFLVFAVLVHVRLKVRDKGLWTAWLAVVGAAVMLFNWIVINFVITGLHSYA